MKSNSAYQPTFSGAIIQLEKFTRSITDEVFNVSLEKWFEQMEMFEILEVSSFDFPNFPETNKVFKLINFKVDSAENGKKRLFNGLIRLGQPEGVILEYHKKIDTYTLKFYAHQEMDAYLFIHNLHAELEKDFRFRKVLAAVISQQESFENSQQLLMKELFG
ncbi:hypothetical protein [Cecembia calidifontis]|uniref:Uncharacterized protein n=1 Tax=Cecembia calidifontis TaxID=1187080 RepID=A0A4Q7PB90_9BACT|nr:hypothetical protein [Cecembia calidifontis]RZS97247.1 hypothetical protein BC751_2850 [Cecembia calidifontis]